MPDAGWDDPKWRTKPTPTAKEREAAERKVKICGYCNKPYYFKAKDPCRCGIRMAWSERKS